MSALVEALVVIERYDVVACVLVEKILVRLVMVEVDELEKIPPARLESPDEYKFVVVALVVVALISVRFVIVDVELFTRRPPDKVESPEA